MAAFLVVEKKNSLHVHAHCSTRESAQRWIDVAAPIYCARGYFSDKTLTPDSFEIRCTDPAREDASQAVRESYAAARVSARDALTGGSL